MRMADEFDRRSVVPEERRRLILERLREEGSLSVLDIEQEFGISQMTARRDLTLLSESGHARRTHGGAVLPELSSHEDSFSARLDENVDQKLRLARAVAGTVMADETVFVDSSSSAYFVVRELLELGTRVTILTNSVPVMAAVSAASSANVELVGLGGTFRRLSRSYVGGQTERSIERFFADRLLFSVKGIDLSGFLTDPDPLEAEVKRLMVSRARSVVLVAAAEKFDHSGLNVIVHASEVNVAYLADAPPAGIASLASHGVMVQGV
jgi:DeoR/GlpR family transcriptional regulator of sugar metabolism